MAESKKTEHFYRKEKEFWGSYQSINDIRSLLQRDRGTNKDDNIWRWLKKRIFLEDSDIWDIQSQEEKDEYWHHVVVTTRNQMMIILLLNTVILWIAFTIINSPFANLLGPNDNIFFKDNVMNNILTWIVLNCLVFWTFFNFKVMCDSLGASSSFILHSLSIFILLVRVSCLLTRAIWTYQYFGTARHFLAMTGGSMKYGIIVMCVDIMMMSCYALYPFSWIWTIFFVLIEATGKFSSFLMFIGHFKSDSSSRKLIATAWLLLFMMIIVLIVNAGNREISLKIIFVNSKIQNKASSQKNNLVVLLHSELSIPLQLISSASQGLCMYENDDKYKDAHHLIVGYSKLINILASEILFLTKIEEDGTNAFKFRQSVSISRIVDEVMNYSSLTMKTKIYDILTVDVDPVGLCVVANPEVILLMIITATHLVNSLGNDLRVRCKRAGKPPIILTTTLRISLFSNDAGSSLIIKLLINNINADISWRNYCESIHYVTLSSIVEISSGLLSVDSNAIEIQFPITSFSIDQTILDARSGNSFQDDRDQVGQINLAVYQTKISIISEDHRLYTCIKELLEDMGWNSDDILSFSLNSREDSAEILREIKGSFIIFTDSIHMCASLWLNRNKSYVVLYSSGAVYMERIVDGKFDYQLSIPCDDYLREQFEFWLHSLPPESGQTKSRSVSFDFDVATLKSVSGEEDNSRDSDRNRKRDKNANSSNFSYSKDTNEEQFDNEKDENLNENFNCSNLENFLSFGMPKFSTEVYDTFLRWNYLFPIALQHDPRSMFVNCHSIVLIMGNLIHFIMEGSGKISLIGVIICYTIVMFRTPIYIHILKPLQISQVSLWRVLFAIYIVLLLIEMIVVLTLPNSPALHCPNNSFSQFVNLQYSSTQGGSDVIEYILVGAFSVFARAPLFPYPWNFICVLYLTLRTVAAIQYLFPTCELASFGLIITVVIVGGGMFSLFGMYFFEKQNRHDFVIFRRRLFEYLFIEDCFAMWQKECSEPMRKILKSKPLIFDLAKDFINKDDCYDCIRRYDTLVQGFQQLSHLYHMLAYNHVVQLGVNSSTNQDNDVELLYKKDTKIGFDSRVVVFLKWEMKVLCKVLCSSLALSNMDAAIVIDCHPSLAIVRLDRILFLSIVSYSLNRSIRYLQHESHRSRSIQSLSHQILLRVFPALSKQNLRFTEPRMLVVQVIHSTFQMPEEYQRNLMSDCDLGIGSQIYEQVLHAHAASRDIKLSQIKTFYTITYHASSCGSTKIIQEFQLVYFLYPSVPSFPFTQRYSSLIICHTDHQNNAFDRLSRWKTIQNRKPKDDSVSVIGEVSVHNFGMLFVTNIYRSSIMKYSNIVDPTVIMIRGFEKHGWKVTTIDVKDFIASSISLDKFDCILIDSFLDAVISESDSVSSNGSVVDDDGEESTEQKKSPKQDDLSIDALITLIRSCGYDLPIVELVRSMNASSSSDYFENGHSGRGKGSRNDATTPSNLKKRFDFSISTDISFSQLDDVVDECCKILVGGHATSLF